MKVKTSLTKFKQSLHDKDNMMTYFLYALLGASVVYATMYEPTEQKRYRASRRARKASKSAKYWKRRAISAYRRRK